MALLKITRLGDPVLRKPAADVAVDQIGSPDVQRLIDDMAETMRDSDGVGLAAPQVNVPKRIILVEVRSMNPRYPDRAEIPLVALINPQIAPLSDETESGWEGCLSIPDLRGVVPRFRRISVRALDRHGKPVEFEAEDFFARVIQHEVDHLNGIVFLDRMKDFSTLTHLREFIRFWLKGEG